MNVEQVIQCRQLSRSFGSLQAVDHLNLSIPKQSIYGFLGPNGSGKSTTMRMLCGLLTPSSGQVEVLGLEIPRQAEQLKHQIGYMAQKFALYDDLTVTENLSFMAKAYNLPGKTQAQRIAETLSRYALQPLQKQMTGTLSGGQKQRLSLAAATLHKPKLLFLDEPTSGVDPQSRRDFWESLFELVNDGVTILVSTHYMDEAERCHGLAILDHGVKVADESPANLIAQIDASVFQIEGTSIMPLKHQLATCPEVLSMMQLGERLRVLLSKKIANPQDYLQRLLAPIDQSLRITPITASIEDVFVMATLHRQSMPPAEKSVTTNASHF
jgi:ABC-2 type transport system ATP-binding protein